MSYCTAQKTIPPSTNTHTCWKKCHHDEVHECLCGKKWLEA